MTMTPGSPVGADDIEPYTRRRPIERTDNTATTYALLTESAPHRWAIIQRHVSGWTCIATGEFKPPIAPKTWGSVFAPLIDGYGDGFDRIPREHYAVSHPESGMIHHRRSMVPGEIAAYCGVLTTAPYVHIRKPGRYEQHCTGCTTTYRAEHFGRCPTEV